MNKLIFGYFLHFRNVQLLMVLLANPCEVMQSVEIFVILICFLKPLIFLHLLK